MAEQEVVEQVEALAVNSIEQMERANIDIQIATAHKYPKHDREHIEQVKKDILDIATLDETTAADCFYVLPRGGKSIDGPSIRLAEIAISCYGNIRDSVRTIEVVSRGQDPHVVVQAVCHDLEKNVAVSIEKRRRITKKKKNQFVDEDDINLAVNSAASFGLRDAAFRVIPKALINPIVEACKRIALGDLKSIVAKRDICIERLNKMGATTDRILSVLECESIEQIGTAQIAVLIGLGTALKDGQCTLEQAFPPIQAEQTGSTADRIKNHFPDTDKKVEVEDLKPEPEVKPEPESTTKAKAEKEKAKLAAAEAKAKAKAEKEKPAPEPEVITEPEPKEEVLPDKWTCLRCDRKLKDDGKDVKGGKCAYCFGEIATL